MEIKEKIEEIAEKSGDAVEEKIEEHADEIVDAIENAEERAEKAEERAEAIADAALESERGHRLTRAEERIEECLRNLEAHQTETKSELLAMEARLLERINSNPSLSIPPMLPILPEEPKQEETIILPPENAEGQKEAETEVEEKQERKHRRRWI